jgi:hypothetical protein
MEHKVMVNVDLSAEIIPGKAAAGFDLGMSLVKFKEIDAKCTTWDDKVFQIQEAVQKEINWLYVPDLQMGVPIDFAGCSYYYGRGAIKLHFNKTGYLNLIEITEGYIGKLYGSIQIGDFLNEAHKLFEIEYDDVEELHFPSEESGIVGLMFKAEELPLDMSPDQIIRAILITL